MTINFPSGQAVNIEKNSNLTVTRRTVRFAKNVYQTNNISSFSEGDVTLPGIPWIVLVILVISIIVMHNTLGNIDYVKSLVSIAVICGVIYNFSSARKRYGLLVVLNSGDRSLFMSADKSGLKEVIAVIYDLIEKDSEAVYQVNISNSKIEGNFVQGSHSGNTSYR